MRFNERREWLFDPVVFKRYDTTTALRIHAEYVRKFSPVPHPKFLEVDRTNANIDSLWHVPTANRTQFSREIEIPAINFFDKPRWTNTPTGLVPKRKDKFWLSHLGLSSPCVDYFPSPGDMVFWNGYRYSILQVDMPPEAYFQQTNVWMGLVVVCDICPEGDARPLQDISQIHTEEISPSGQMAKDRVEKHVLSSVSSAGPGSGAAAAPAPAPPPVPLTFYYGRSASTILDASGILGLTSVSASSFLRTFSVPSGSGYIYFAFPVSKPAPNHFTLQPFEVPMADSTSGYRSEERRVGKECRL